MFKTITILALAISAVLAAPKPSGLIAAPLAVAPAIAPAYVTAQSSQVVARNYNALVAPVVAAAPYVAPAPVVAPAPYLAASPYVASAPYLAPAPVAAPAPLLTASYRVASPYLFK